MVLAELLVGLIVLSLVVSVGIPYLHSFLSQMYRRSADYDRYSQLQFAEFYLTQLGRDAKSIAANADTLTFTTTQNVYLVGLKSQELYVKQTAYRYLTTSPVIIDQLGVVSLTPKAFEIDCWIKGIKYPLMIEGH